MIATLSALERALGYVVVVVVIILLILVCWLVRKKYKIGTYTKEEEEAMKSSLDLLLKEEDVIEGKDYSDEV